MFGIRMAYFPPFFANRFRETVCVSPHPPCFFGGHWYTAWWSSVCSMSSWGPLRVFVAGPQLVQLSNDDGREVAVVMGGGARSGRAGEVAHDDLADGRDAEDQEHDRRCDR